MALHNKGKKLDLVNIRVATTGGRGVQWAKVLYNKAYFYILTREVDSWIEDSRVRNNHLLL